MAKNSSSTNTVSKVPKKKRKGIHSKKKSSQLKTSKNYKKLRVGQG
jgi:hypothetical protein